MAKRYEPVKHTCPEINTIIDRINAVIKDMRYAVDQTEDEDLANDLETWIDTLAEIAEGKYCELEGLRDANAALREWGNDLVSEIEEMENEQANG